MGDGCFLNPVVAVVQPGGSFPTGTLTKGVWKELAER